MSGATARLVVMLAGLGIPVRPAPAQAPVVHAVHAEEPPVIDAALGDPVWERATPIRLPYEWFPGDNTAAPVETICMIAADAMYLYVGCRAFDPAPDAIRRHFADRDDVSGEDGIAVLLDPTSSTRRGYRFMVTALGVQADGLYSEEGGSNETWDATWRSAGRVTDTGYHVEFAIPLAVLRTSDDDGARPWRFLLDRAYPRGANFTFGMVPLDRNNNCRLCQAGTLTGVTQRARSAPDVSLQPTITAVRFEGERETGGFDADSDLRVGVSGGWGISSATRLNAAVNPDFSQVEADAAEFEVNRRFALAFDEKRPFFLDGRDYFDVRGDLVFTRTVVDPIAGAKVTGSAATHSFGVFAAVDRINSIIVPGSERSQRVSSDADVTGIVARYRTDLPNSSSVGLLATRRSAAAYRNAVLALDGAVRFARSHRVRFVVAGSETDDASDVEALTGRTAAFRGLMWNVRYDLETRRWEIEAGHRRIARGFRADAGLVQRVDLMGPEAQVTHIVWGDRFAWFDRLALSVEGLRLTDLAGAVTDEKFEVSAEYRGPLQSGLAIEYARRRSAFEGRLFARDVTAVSAGFRPADAIGLSASVEFGDEVDTDNARLGRFLSLRLGSGLRLGHALRLDGSTRWRRLSIAAGRVFRAVLSEARIEYHFGRRTFIRVIVQHRDVVRDPTLYVDPVDRRSNRLFSQALFSYQATPETVFFLGYSGTARDFDGSDIVPQERSVFVKIGYGWRL